MPISERNWGQFWKTHIDLENGVYGPANPTLLKCVEEFAGERVGLSALDLGSGDGRYSIPLSIMGFRVDAIDKSREAISLLRKRASKFDSIFPINVEVTDIFSILPQQRSYDLIICSGLIEEIPLEKHEELILGLQGWTNPSGINVLRYVVEKRISPQDVGEIVADHEKLTNLYHNWKVKENELEPNFRQANVGREINGATIKRYFKPATIVAIRN